MADTVESPVRGDAHAGFGERPAETDRWQQRHRAAGRLTHPGAQLTFTDVDGHRITAILTNTGLGIVPGQVAGLELRHRQHARVEDRIRETKATRLRNLPCRAFNENACLETVLTAVDLVAWTKLIAFTEVVELARCEIHAFRYRVLHVAARLTRGSRQVLLRIDKTWAWAAQIAEGFHRLRAAFA